MKRYLIAHDLGTSGDKATLYDLTGKLLASITYSYDTCFFNGNWAEQDPQDWWKAVCFTNHKLLEGRDASEVAGISFSGQMMGCVCVDATGVPVRKAIIWADQRSQKEEMYLREKIDETRFYQITGNRISASYSLEKLMWIRSNEPELFKRTYKMLLPKDYIIYHLTGRFVTDYSDASGTNAFDMNQKVWSEEILEAAKIDRSLLPQVYPSTEIAGSVLSSIAEECGLKEGTRVVIGGGDGVCASVGAGSVTENIAYNYLGSSSWIAYTSKVPVFDEQMRTFNFMHLIDGLYIPIGTMQAAGNSLSFMKNTICDGLSMMAEKEHRNVYDLINQEIAASVLGANELLYLPYLLGERSPRWNPDARGAFVGLKMEHKKADMLRATVEGILFNLNIIMEIFKKGADIKEITVIGGLAKGKEICQILSDIYGIPAKRLNFLEEATSMGAAVAAGVGTGVFHSFDAIHQFIQVDEMVIPNMDNHLKYQKYQNLFDETYEALQGIYKKLANLECI